MREKRLIGGAGDSLQLFPLQYQWAWNMYLENMDNHWTPREIQVAQDVAQWKGGALSEGERHLFLSIMAQLTTFDMQRGDETAEAMQGLFTAPEIKQYLKRLTDEEALHCYAEGTEVLTARGWVEPKDISDDDLVAQFAAGEITFVRHLGVVKDRYIGPMTEFRNKAVRSSVTPNHWVVSQSVAKDKAFQWMRDRAQCVSLSNRRLPTAALPVGPLGVGIDSLDRLRIAFQADGSPQHNTAVFRFKKRRKIKRLRLILGDLGVDYKEVVRPDDVTEFRFKNLMGLEKNFDWVCLSEISYNWARGFIDETVLWDGNTHRSSGMRRYFTNKPSVAKKVQAVACLGGYHARWRDEPHGMIVLTYRDSAFVHGQTIEKTEVAGYDGYVYSVGVPARAIVVRYEGCVLISSNSWSYQYIIENMGLDPEDIYTRYQTVPAMKDRVEMATETADMVRDVVFAQECRRRNSEVTIDLIWTKREKQILLYAMVFWFCCFEGIWFFLNLAGPIQNLARQAKFINAAEQFQYILRDESQHIRFGINLINEFMGDYPECMTDGFRIALVDLFVKSVQLEERYIQYCLPEGVLGYSVSAHVETAKFYANMRAKSIGISEIYPAVSHQFPWMSEQLLANKEKNFFETRVTEYQTGGSLKWD